MPSFVLANATIAAMEPGAAPYGLIGCAGVAVRDERIAWVGKVADLPDAYAHWAREDLGGRLVTPALVDCHTHAVYAGNRAREFEMRLEGASYEDIARAGGGIRATVDAVRAAGEEYLIAQSLPRIDAMIAAGTTTVEIKSGYGLSIAAELKTLRAARGIALQRPVRVLTTYLAAHALPAEYQGRADAYIDEVCIPGLRQAYSEGLVDAVDGFCETIGFTPAQLERVFAAAASLGCPVKLHAEQLSASGGARLAARFGALSADHLEYADEADVAAMARAGTVAVLLPGAYYALRERRPPPVALLRRHGVPMALATDCNPGTSPMTSLPLAMNMACTLFGLTAEEALAGVTREGARALGLADCGRVVAGLRADLAVWNVDAPAELAGSIGFNPLYRRYFGGTH